MNLVLERGLLSIVVAENLGAKVMAIPPARQFSSVVKGETVKDTIAMFCGYGIDAIVMRADKEGMVREADEAACASGRAVSIINAGDGKGQHPTQSLLDLYTIKRFFENELGKNIHSEKINVAFVGDLANGRTVRSLAYLLNKYQDANKLEFFFVSPAVLKMRDDIKEYLSKKGIKFFECEKLIDIADKINVCYMTRVQKERLDGVEVDYDFIRGNCSITQEVAKKLKKEAIVMHPLPRDPAFGEIPEWFDSDPRAKYIQQAENGLYVRMALLKKVLIG